MDLFRHWPSSLLTATFLTIAIATLQDSNQQHVLAPTPTTFRNPWNFNFSSPAPHYFASVQSLARQWPNTLFPIGHSIVPCEIPSYTKLYHGRIDADFPESPEWLSFDVEMAYGIMGSTRSSHLLTYQTTHLTKVVYFDGESANLMGAGQLDFQMLQIYLNTSGAPWDPSDNLHFGIWGEYDRAIGLCKWIKEKGLGGSGWGLEGVVRMNAGFELIWCDFDSPSLKLVSHLNVTAPLLPAPVPEIKAKVNYETTYFPLPPAATQRPADPMPPPNWRQNTEGEPFLRTQAQGWFTSATAHYAGETRLKPLTCAIMSYYSPIFQSQATARAQTERKFLNLTEQGRWTGPGSDGERQLALKQLMRRRRTHSLGSVNIADAAAMKTASEIAFSDLINGTADCSGLDWTVLTNEIVDRYATELLNFLNLISALEENLELKNETELESPLTGLREKSHDMLLPFLEYPGTSKAESEPSIWAPSSDLSKATCARCRFQHTRLLSSEFGIRLNPQEEMLKWAVEETFGGICSVIIGVGFGIEQIWEETYGIIPNQKKQTGKMQFENELRWWREGVEELMSWLGWAGNWVRCEERCAWDEYCYIPMWPMIKSSGRGGRGPPRGPPAGDIPGDSEPPRDGLPGERPSPPPGDHDSPPDEGNPPRSPGQRPPQHGERPGGGRGGRRPGRGGRSPGWMTDETDLWEPKCVKADYILG